MKTIEKWILAICCVLLVIAIPGCGKSGDGDEVVPLPWYFPPVVDHAFSNGQSTEGDLPSNFSVSGPVISNVIISPGSMTIQGQVLTFTVTFTDLEMDLVSPSLLIQIADQDEYWTIGPEHFGGILGNDAVVILEVSRDFEPEAHILRIGLMDDAGNIGNIYSTVLIVLQYTTPEIVSLTPGDGEIDVPLNTPIHGLFSSPLLDEPANLTLTLVGQDVPGSVRVLPNMKGITLVPGEFLLPDTEYVATLVVGEPGSGTERTALHRFTTGPLALAPNLTGQVYSVEILPDNIVEPVGAEIIFNAIQIPPILIKIKTFDEINNIITSIGALSKDDPPVQHPAFPTLAFPDQNAVLNNPYFSVGPAELVADLYALTGGAIDVEISIYDFMLSGRFSPDGNWIEHCIITGYLDGQELNDAINQFMPGSMPFDVCIQLPGSCDADKHVTMRVENITGPHEPQVTDLYDLSVDANPSTIVGSAGGSVAVSGETTVNGDPFGTVPVDLETTHGTFPLGGLTETVTTVDGLYSVTLTVPSGLSPGTIIGITASATSPIGDATRSTKVIVQ